MKSKERRIVMATKKYVVTGDQYRDIDRRMREIKRQLDQKSGSPLNPEKVNEALQNLQTIIEGIEDKKPDNVFPITVDYNHSLADMIKAGNYDWVNSDINSKHFPVKGKGKHELEAVLFHFDRYIESEEAIAEMDKQGYRPGKVEELLALGEKYPDLQKEFPIVALGSVWRGRHGRRHVACLFWPDRGRDLGLDWFDCRWSADWRFLALPKK
jgi:hypothetical protein